MVMDDLPKFVNKKRRLEKMAAWLLFTLGEEPYSKEQIIIFLTEKLMQQPVKTPWLEAKYPGFVTLLKEREWDFMYVMACFKGYIQRREHSQERRKKRYLDDVSEYLGRYIRRPVSSREELIQLLKQQETLIQAPEVKSVEGNLTLSLYSVLEFIKIVDAGTIEEFIKKLNSKIRKKEKEQNSQLEDQLQEYLEGVAMPLNVEVYVDEAVWYGGTIGFKVYIGGDGYLDWFTGSFNDLKALLVEQVRMHGKDYVECPFCKNRYVRSLLKTREVTYCACGSQVVVEEGRVAGKDGYSMTGAALVYEGYQELGLPLPNGYKYKKPHICFQNVKVAKRIHAKDFDIWFVKKPWSLKLIR